LSCFGLPSQSAHPGAGRQAGGKEEDRERACDHRAPREYDPQALLPVIKPIWFAAFQPCGLLEWLAAYEKDHRRFYSDVRQALMGASPRTLNRLLEPLRVTARRRGGTRPSSLLRQSIPIRGEWTEEGPGWKELDTDAVCGGSLDDLHLWMLDGVDIRTDWTEQRAVENRGAHAVLVQVQDVGIDSDNGGEFINHHLARYAQARPAPLHPGTSLQEQRQRACRTEKLHPCAPAFWLRAL
jgi:hypothetical protein